MLLQMKGAHTAQFADSAADAIAYAESATRYSQRAWQNGSRIEEGATFAEAKHMAINGWREGAEKVNAALAAMYAPNAVRLATHTYDYAGERPDVGRFLAGSPDCMYRRKRSAGNRPVVHIVVNTAMKADVSVEQAMNYGIGLVAAIDRLESAGRRAELDRVGVVEWDGRRSLQGWKVKSAEDSVDVSALAFAIAHPASHRRLVWGMRCCHHYFHDSTTWMPKPLERRDAVLIGAEDAIMIDGVISMGSRCRTPQDALMLVAERLNKAAGETLVEVE